MKQLIHLTVNGRLFEREIPVKRMLIDLLREDLGLMGTKRGCDLGACGACTVLINGEAHLSCLMLALDAVGKEVVTIEGLSMHAELHPLQKAFVEKGGVQCGFCTPGMIMTAKGILDEEQHPTEEIIKKKMAGNLCRCTGYKKIIEAVVSVAK